MMPKVMKVNNMPSPFDIAWALLKDDVPLPEGAYTGRTNRQSSIAAAAARRQQKRQEMERRGSLSDEDYYAENEARTAAATTARAQGKVADEMKEQWPWSTAQPSGMKPFLPPQPTGE
jgi:hypothetical protein